MPRLLVALAAALFLLVPTSGSGAAEPAQVAQRAQTTTGFEKVFSDLERRIIREVLGAAGGQDEDTEKRKNGKKAKGAKGAPPGLAKRDRLPPGLERQLERNGHLPPGLAKKQFPASLSGRLPAPPHGTERVIIGNDAVLIDAATNVILDVIYDVVRNGN